MVAASKSGDCQFDIEIIERILHNAFHDFHGLH
jgi:hypothetical protein